MNAKNNRRTERPRLGSGERARLLAEIAKIDAPFASGITETPKRENQSDAIRSALSELTEQEVPPTEPEEATPKHLAVEPDEKAPTAAPKRSSQAADRHRASNPTSSDPHWSSLPMLSVDPGLLDRNLVITARRTDPAHGAFDVLRTRLVQALAEKGWRRVAITSPTAGCGKSFTAINLAVTLSRYDQCRTIVMDMDMRKPGLSRYLGVQDQGSTGDFLRGITPAEDYFTRLRSERLHIGSNLAIGLNGQVEDYAAELFQQHTTGDVLARMEDDFHPEVVLFDLPPALAQDDVIAFRPHFDCILMVVGGGITTAEEVREAQRRIGEDKPLLGIVLNKAEVEGDYSY